MERIDAKERMREEVGGKGRAERMEEDGWRTDGGRRGPDRYDCLGCTPCKISHTHFTVGAHRDTYLDVLFNSYWRLL